MRSVRGLAVAVLSVSALTTACGGGTKGTATAPTSAVSTTSIDPAADKTLAASIVLQPTDLPSDWAGSPHQPDPSAATTAAQVAACLGIPDSYPDATANADSEDFTLAKLVVSSNVMVFRNSGDVNSDAAAIVGPKGQGCLSDQVKSAVGAGATVDAKITPGPAPGRPVQKALLTAHILGPTGSGAGVFSEIVYLAEGRIEASVTFVSLGGPVPNAVIDLAAGRVATRLEGS